MSAWLAQHLQVFKQVLHRCSQDFSHTLLISLVIGITLTLPVLGYVLIQNLSDLTGKAHQEAQISVFLRADLAEETISGIRHKLETHPAVRSVKFVSKEQALEQLESSFSDATLIESLQHNPLPDAFQIEPDSLDTVKLGQLKTQLGNLDGVQEVVLDTDWLNRINSLVLLAKRILWLVAGLFGLLLITVISNTVRMQIMSQRDEIELSQLIGATAAFTRRPFLYLGWLYGLLGGLLSIAISVLIVYIFNRSIAPLAAAYQSDFFLNYPDLYIAITICLIAAAIGLFSAYFSATRYISKSIG
jgi:cell division transport system permease protein